MPHDRPPDRLPSALHEISESLSALWCALEVAKMRPPDPEEDRRDVLMALSLVEEMGKRLRSLQTEVTPRSPAD